jgi:hypothetical protein
LAEKLLALGAPIDYPSGYGKTGMPALQFAAKTTTKEAAFFMKYLLLKGARTLGRSGREIGQEKGAMGIATWVGETWEELQHRYLMTRITSQGF